MKFVWVLIAGAALTLTGCTPCNSSSDCKEGEVCGAGHCQPIAACSAGQTAPCVCEGGAQGTQSCNETGTAFAACACAPDLSCGGVGCAVMPDLVGKSVAEAGQLLKELSLKLPDPSDPTGFIVERRVNDPPSAVLEQFPVAGSRLAKHSAPVLRVVIPPDQETLGLPNSTFLVGALAQDDEQSSQAYYDAVDPGPVPSRGTLKDWKLANGFGSLADGIPPEPADDEASAIYSNRADLGFGRHMHMRRKGQHIAFYVDNYPTVEDTVNNTRFFATVAMEWSPPAGNPSGRAFTKFFVFNKKGVRIYDPALDTHGAKLQPGVCLGCHGGNVTDLNYTNGGNLGAHFIPFDLDSLGFSTRPGYTRADQEVQFKKLNLAVKMTYPADDPEYPAADPAPVPGLIDGWYGGPGMPGDTFDGTFVPPAWGVDQAAWDIYLDVFAKSCRGCHMQREPFRNFSTYDKFWGKQTLIHQRVFEDGAMPLSEKGNLNFWLSSPSEPALLAQWLGKPLTGPGRPVVRLRVTNNGLIRPGDLVELNGSESQYSQQFVWTQTSGPPVQLHTAGNQAAFAAPSVAANVGIQLMGKYGALTGTTVALVQVVDLPSAPRNVTATPGVRSAVVAWLAPLRDGNSALTNYKVTASIGGAAVTVGAALTTVTFTGLPDNTPVTFTVTAINTVGLESAPSAPSSTISTNGPPGAPQSVTGAPGDSSVVVSWLAPAILGGSAITGYTVTASPGGATASSAGALTATINGLSNGTAYTFSVTATSSVGTGPAATSAPVTPRTVPGAPSAVVATRGNGLANVTWTGATTTGGAAITGYVLDAFTTTGCGTPPCATGLSFSSPCTTATCAATFTGLANGTTYQISARAINAAGPGAASALSAAVTPSTTPSAPAIGTAVAGNGAATVAWSKPSDGGNAITSYTIDAYTALGCGSPPCATALSATSACATASCTAAVGGLANGTTYVFTVKAINGIGTSPASAASNLVTPGTTPGAPAAPQAVTASAATESATLTWSAPIDPGTSAITGYTITASPGGATTAAGPGATSKLLPGLTGGLTYTFTITATNSVGTGPGAASNAVPIVGRPQAPTIGTATRGNGSAGVTWTAPTNNGGSALTSYTVTASPGGASATTPNGATTSATVSGLSNGTSYTFSVVATNAFGNSSASSASNAVVPATTPSAPAIGTAVAGNGAATVAWSKPFDGGDPISGYTIDAFAATGCGSPPCATGLTASSSCATASCTAAFSGLTNGNTYEFTVKATNTVGTSAASGLSNQVTPGTTPGAPSAPQTFVATAGTESASLTWTAPFDSGTSSITGYTITANPGALTTTATAAAVSKTFSGLTGGVTYTFTITASNSAGTGPGASSSGVFVVGRPQAPTIGTATRGNQSVAVTWTAPTNNGGSAITSYTVTASPGGATAVTPNGSTTNATVSGLTNGTAYTFTVVATNAFGNSGSSAASAAATPATTPSAPAIGTATAGNGSATVAWSQPASGGAVISSYTLDAFTAVGCGTPPCATALTASSACATASCTASFGGLTNGTTYEFTVKANNAVGTSAASGFSNIVTPGTSPGAPSAPRSPTAVAGSSVAAKETADLSWTQPLDLGSGSVGTLSYTITESQTATQITSSCATLSCTATFTGLTGGLNYTFAITASTNVGTGPAATTNSISALGRAQPPTSVSAAAGNTQATVSWSAPANNGGSAITSYTATASPGGATATTPNGSTTSATVSGLSNGTSYSFTVRANNAYGTSAASAGSSGVTPSGLPTAPTSVSTPSRGNGTITVAWTSGSANGSALTASTIYIFSSSSGNCSSGLSFVKSASGGCTAASCGGTVVSGLTNGTSYCAEVTDTNANGEGAVSALAGPQVPATSPGAPNLSLVAGSATIAATYSTNGTGGLATSLQVDLCLGGQSCTGAGSCSFGGTQASWASGSPHTFTAKACNYSSGSASCTWNGAAVVGVLYRVCAYATNAVGTATSTATSTPFVSYVADNLGDIWTTKGCRSCHNSHTPNLPTVANNTTEYNSIVGGPYGAYIWACPLSGTSEGTIGCMGAQGWVDHAAEVNTLQRWIADGSRF